MFILLVLLFFAIWFFVPYWSKWFEKENIKNDKKHKKK